MMEHTTDRLFWTLTSIIVGALILTIGVNAFPKATQEVIQPISGILKQADTTTHTANSAANNAMSNGDNSNNSNSNSSPSSKSSTPTDPDAQAKANAVNVDNSQTISIQNNGDGTASLTNMDLVPNDKSGYNISQDGDFSISYQMTYNIPEYVISQGHLLKITSLAPNSLNQIMSYGANSSSFPEKGPNSYNPTININIPDSIQTWNSNTSPFGQQTPSFSTSQYATYNFTMSNNELNKIVPNAASTLTQSGESSTQQTTQFPATVNINGITNGNGISYNIGY